MPSEQQEFKPLTDEEIALRNKPWTELTDSQKIDRQRDIIKDLQRTVGFMQDQLSRLQMNFNQHQHSESGIMIPLMSTHPLGAVSAGLGKLANPNYF